MLWLHFITMCSFFTPFKDFLLLGKKLLKKKKDGQHTHTHPPPPPPTHVIHTPQVSTPVVQVWKVAPVVQQLVWSFIALLRTFRHHHKKAGIRTCVCVCVCDDKLLKRVWSVLTCAEASVRTEDSRRMYSVAAFSMSTLLGLRSRGITGTIRLR